MSGDAISSTKFNSLVQDLESDANVDRPIAAGGTGASTASAARTNLGLAIGTDVQAFDAGLLSIAGLTTLADRSIYTTASDTYAVYTLTAAGRAILDDADASAQRTTLGLGSLATLSTINNDNWSGTDLAVANGGTGASDASTALTNLGALAASAYTASDVLSKLLTVDGAGSGLDADRLDGVQPSAFALTILDDADAAAVRTTMGLANGATTTISAFALTMLDDVDAAAVRATIGVGLGTGDLVAANNLSDVANASTSRTNLGLAIGTNVQAYDAGLQSIAGLTTTADRGIYTTASDTYAVYTLTAAGRAILDDADAAAQRTTLGLGTAAVVADSTLAHLAGTETFTGVKTFTPGILVGTGTHTYTAGSFGFSDANHGFLYRPPRTGALYAHAFQSFAGTTLVGITDAGVLSVATNTVWHAGNDGAGSGLDADTVDGYHVGTSGATIPLLNGANSWSSTNNFTLTGTSGMATATSSLGRPEVINNSTGAAFMTFHRQGSYASYFGLDTDNVWKVGGWSAGAAAYKIWHEGNDGAGSGLDADTLDGVQESALGRLGAARTWTESQTYSNGKAWLFGADTNTWAVYGFNGQFYIEQTGQPTTVQINSSRVLLYAGEAVARVDSGTAANSGKISWGTAAPGTLAEGEIYLRHA